MPHLSSVSNLVRRRPVSSFHGGQEIGGGGAILTQETPAGAVNGSNVTFALSHVPASLLVFRNGVLQALGSDYTLAGSTITFVAAPQTGDAISAVLG